MLARGSIFCRGKGGLSTGVRQVIVSVGGLDRGGGVLVGGHEGGQLFVIHGVGERGVIWLRSILVPSSGVVGGG